MEIGGDGWRWMEMDGDEWMDGGGWRWVVWMAMDGDGW